MAWQPGKHVSEVEVSGWVRSVRKSSGVRFVDITDGSSMRPLQAVVDKRLAAEYVAPSQRDDNLQLTDLGSIRPGAAVRLRGTWQNDASKQPAKSSEKHDVGAQVSKLESSSQGVDAGATSSTAGVSSFQGEHTTNSSHGAAKGSIPTSCVSGGLDRPANQPPTTAELQVSEVEILGPSDPQVRLIILQYSVLFISLH